MVSKWTKAEEDLMKKLQADEHSQGYSWQEAEKAILSQRPGSNQNQDMELNTNLPVERRKEIAAALDKNFNKEAINQTAWASVGGGMWSKAHGQGTGAMEGVGASLMIESTTPKRYLVKLGKVGGNMRITDEWYVKLSYATVPSEETVVADLKKTLLSRT
ncbi:hypothetical protein FRC12_006230 [Ceratobasidium sp. 428]|nr:hypothetical protein FRC12_006230 [Ceratobasidium sp. 428]